MSLLKDYRELACHYPNLLPPPGRANSVEIVDNLLLAFGLLTPVDTPSLTWQIKAACQWKRVPVPDDIEPLIHFLQKWLPIIQDQDDDTMQI